MVPTLVPVMIVVRVGVGDITQLLPIGQEEEALLQTAGSMMTHRDLRVGAITIRRRALGIIVREVVALAVALTHEAAARAIRENVISSEAIRAENGGETQSPLGNRACFMNRNNSLDTQSSKKDSTRPNGNHRDMHRRVNIK